MKKYKCLLLLLITAFCMALVGCKKYPDGPLISFESKMKRIAGNEYKTWEVAYFSVNGHDSTSNILSQAYYGKYWFYSKNAKSPNYFYLASTNGSYCTFGRWRFDNRKNDLFILQESGCAILPQFDMNPYIASKITWEIRRLTDTDLWLKTTFKEK